MSSETAQTDLNSILNSEIKWTGQLDDDCTCEWHGLTGRAEAMSEWSWFCCVYRDRETLMHNSTDGFNPNSGESARKIVELFMRMEAIKELLSSVPASPPEPPTKYLPIKVGQTVSVDPSKVSHDFCQPHCGKVQSIEYDDEIGENVVFFSAWDGKIVAVPESALYHIPASYASPPERSEPKLPWIKATGHEEFECGDSYLVAVPVRSRENANVKFWWEYNVITATETGWDLNGESGWGWDWTDVMWYIPCKQMSPADVKAVFGPAPAPQQGEGSPEHQQENINAMPEVRKPDASAGLTAENEGLDSPPSNLQGQEMPRTVHDVGDSGRSGGRHGSDGAGQGAEEGNEQGTGKASGSAAREASVGEVASPIPAKGGEGLDLTQFEGHTPGPWVYEPDNRHDDNVLTCEHPQRRIASVYGAYNPAVNAVNAANARLISAAPAILSYARKLEAELAETEEAREVGVRNGTHLLNQLIDEEAITAALRSTVSKLEGEASRLDGMMDEVAALLKPGAVGHCDGTENCMELAEIVMHKLSAAERRVAETTSRIRDVVRRIGVAASLSWVRGELEKLLATYRSGDLDAIKALEGQGHDEKTDDRRHPGMVCDGLAGGIGSRSGDAPEVSGPAPAPTQAAVLASPGVSEGCPESIASPTPAKGGEGEMTYEQLEIAAGHMSDDVISLRSTVSKLEGERDAADKRLVRFSEEMTRLLVLNQAARNEAVAAAEKAEARIAQQHAEIVAAESLLAHHRNSIDDMKPRLSAAERRVAELEGEWGYMLATLGLNKVNGGFSLDLGDGEVLEFKVAVGQAFHQIKADGREEADKEQASELAAARMAGR